MVSREVGRRESERETHDSVDPARRDERRVALLEVHPVHLVAHVAEPRLLLPLGRPAPLLVRLEVGLGRPDEEEGLAAAQDVVEDGRPGKVDVPVGPASRDAHEAVLLHARVLTRDLHVGGPHRVDPVEFPAGSDDEIASGLGLVC